MKRFSGGKNKVGTEEEEKNDTGRNAGIENSSPDFQIPVADHSENDTTAVFVEAEEEKSVDRQGSKDSKRFKQKSNSRRASIVLFYYGRVFAG